MLHSGGAEKAVPGRVFAEALSDAGVAVSAVTKTVTLAFRKKRLPVEILEALAALQLKWLRGSDLN